MPEKIPPDTIAEVGVALFGERWIAPMARAFDVQPRTIHYWTKSGAPAPRFMGHVARHLIALRESISRVEQIIITHQAEQ